MSNNAFNIATYKPTYKRIPKKAQVRSGKPPPLLLVGAVLGTDEELSIFQQLIQ